MKEWTVQEENRAKKAKEQNTRPTDPKEKYRLIWRNSLATKRGDLFCYVWS